MDGHNVAIYKEMQRCDVVHNHILLEADQLLSRGVGFCGLFEVYFELYALS